MSAIVYIKSKEHHLVVFIVNLKWKSWKGSNLPGSFDVGKLQGEDSREIFQEQSTGEFKICRRWME